MTTSKHNIQSAEAVPGERPLKLRWVMIGLAFLATVINYLDRQTLSVVASELKKQFAMKDETYGLIVSAFMSATFGLSAL